MFLVRKFNRVGKLFYYDTLVSSLTCNRVLLKIEAKSSRGKPLLVKAFKLVSTWACINR